MKRNLKQAYINAWKREHCRKTYECGRLKLAYNVPGTKEHGELCMLESCSETIFGNLKILV